MKHVVLALLVAGSAAAAPAQDAPSGVVDHSVVHTQTVTHNDGRKHRQVTRFRHRTIVKTPQGTMIHTVTRTTSTPPK